MASLIGIHTRTGGVKQIPSRAGLYLNGAGLGTGEQHPDTIRIVRDTRVFPNGEAPPDFDSFVPSTSVTWEIYGRYWYSERTKQSELPDGSLGWRNHKEAWAVNPADYYQICNEQGGGEGADVPVKLQRLVDIERAIMQAANADGRKCCILNLAGGSPGSFELWKQICAPFIVEAWESGGNIYGRHLYADWFVNDAGAVNPGQTARVLAELEYLRSQGYGGGVVLTEAGLFGGYGVADYPFFEKQVKRLEQLLLPYADMAIGLCWWQMGTYKDFNSDYTQHMKALVPYLEQATLPRWTPPEVEEPMEPKECDLYLDLGRFVHLLPQDTTDDEIAAVARQFNAAKNSFVFSHDDAELIVAHGRGENPEGKKVSEVRIWEPERFPDDVVDYFASRGYKYSIGYFEGKPPQIEIINIVNNLPLAFARYSRTLDQIDAIAIHHFASNSTIQQVHDYHLSLGWPGIGYHFVVDHGGEIYQTIPLDKLGTHVANNNTRSIGVALRGNFTDQPPAQAMLDSARRLVSHLKQLVPTIDEAAGHRQFPGAQTQCPGNTWTAWLPYVVGGEIAEPEPDPKPEPQKLDMLTFLRGDGRIFEMQHGGGGQERNQAQAHATDANAWYIAKGENEGHYELWRLVKMVVDGAIEDVICLDTDTSPADASDGTARYYKIRKNSGMAPKYKRFMAIGETFRDGGHTVQFYRKDNCQPHAENSGAAENVTTIVALHESMTFANGIILANVLEVQENSERQFWCAGYGRVKWISQWGSSQISEEHGPGQRPDIKREVIGCLG